MRLCKAVISFTTSNAEPSRNWCRTDEEADCVEFRQLGADTANVHIFTFSAVVLNWPHGVVV